MNHLACGYCPWTGTSLHEMITHVNAVHQPPEPGRFYTLGEAAEITGITSAALWARIKAGTLPAERDEVDRRNTWWVAEHVVEQIEKGRSLKYGN